MRRRISKDFLKVKQDQLARAKQDRERYRTLLEGKDSPFWKEVQARIEGKAAGVENKLDEWVGMPERELWAALEQRKIYRFLKDMVNESENALAMLDKRVEELEVSLRDAKEGAVV